MIRLKPKRPQSALELAIRWREWQILERFPGACHWRRIGSEVEMMHSLTPAVRRERIRNSQTTVFRLRLRDRWTGSIIFG